MFYFKLHPNAWMFGDDATQLFRALELADGRYLISWELKGKHHEVIYESEEVSNELINNMWIITDENGDY